MAALAFAYAMMMNKTFHNPFTFKKRKSKFDTGTEKANGIFGSYNYSKDRIDKLPAYENI